MLTAALCGLPSGAFAQRLSFGVAAGASLTESFRIEDSPSGSETLQSYRYYSPSKDYIIGATMEVRLPWSAERLSVEVDGLYRKLHLATAAVQPDGSLNGVSPSPVVTWEFPVLAKFRFELPKLNPFIEAGPSLRTTGNLNGANPSHFGITAGLGVELHTGALNIAPVLRYTRWAAEGLPSYRPNSRPDQIEILVGLNRAPEVNAHPLGRRFSLGAMVGTTLTNDYPDTTTRFNMVDPVVGGPSSVIFLQSGLKSFIYGPMVGLDVVKGFSLESDAIHHPLRYSYADSVSGATTTLTTRGTGGATTWEFPVLARYARPVRRIKPFIELGPSFRLPTGRISTHGVSAGAGIEIPWGPMKIAPAVRYTHWAEDSPPRSSGVAPNEVALLAGFSF